MKDFRLFDISDFVMDEDFIRWTAKKTKADNDFWVSWLKQNPGKYMVVAEARRILESIRTDQIMISEAEKQHEIQRLMEAINNPFQSPEPKAWIVSISKKWWYVAAVLLIAIASSTFYFLK